ncbi:MAG: MucB/RseB C-terminal domain-containing protein [Reinekea sp.]|jgi:sigma-E factor negative regulatory protein RseB
MFRVVFVLALMLFPVLGQAMEWQQLEEMRQAVQQQNYRGEFLHRRGDQTSVYSIVHRFEDGQGTELLKQQDGDMIEILRHDDKVICYFPAGSESAANHGIPAAPFSQVSQLALKQIASNYHAHSLGQAIVAGLKTNIIELTSDEWRFSQKLWLEVDTRLLLQSEIMDARGQVLEQFRYTRIELGADIGDQELVSRLSDQQGVMQQVNTKTAQPKPISSGLHTKMSWAPEGFNLVSAQQQMNATGWIDKRTYSDGLASYSVFAEMVPEDEDSKQSAMAKMGATLAFMTHNNGLAITIVGEIPDATARQVAKKLQMEDF